MPRTDHNQIVDADGNVISEEVVEVPIKVVDDQTFTQSKKRIKGFWDQFMENGVPVGQPTAVEARDWLLSLSAAIRYTYHEMDDEDL